MKIMTANRISDKCILPYVKQVCCEGGEISTVTRIEQSSCVRGLCALSHFGSVLFPVFVQYKVFTGLMFLVPP